MKPAYTCATLIAAALALSACGSKDAGTDAAKDTGPKTMAEAQEEAKKLDRPDPGEYKQTMEVTRLDIPGMDPKQAEAMKGMMKASQERTFCLTPADSEKGFKDMFDEVGKGGECSYSRFDVSGGTLDAVMNCKNPNEGTATIALNGKVSSNGSDVTVSIDQAGSKNPMGDMKMTMHMTTARLGDCKTGG
ncbi:DUF3617 domain-containing protein [Novosphingobium colocasiae]|uniref:DUF3617 domain-containing protein n=1 Tax=Novosphingobium colocasiae TaxID=1256513 RepID=A0A918PAG6_9SPHN|nr:DUF3617 domain-containing protein [Novosphingobium colocasiae]GGY93730.1 hypothetical protein GCM10011614_05860 [Novosphingobium colocasiae]